MRSQIATLKQTLGDDAKTADVRAQVDSLDRKMLAVEEQLLQTKVTGRGQDLVRYPFRLSEQLIYLGASVTGSDFGPTDAHRQVQTILKEQLRQVRSSYDAVMTKDLDAFKQMLRSRNVQNAIIS